MHGQVASQSSTTPVPTAPLAGQGTPAPATVVGLGTGGEDDGVGDVLPWRGARRTVSQINGYAHARRGGRFRGNV